MSRVNFAKAVAKGQCRLVSPPGVARTAGLAGGRRDLCWRIDREAIPRLVELAEALQEPHLVQRRSGLHFEGSLHSLGKGDLRPAYVAEDPEGPVIEPHEVSPPRQIYVRGHWSLPSALMSSPYPRGPLHLAIAGPVEAREDATALASRLACQAVSRFRAIVFAGFAGGVDLHAHLGALDAYGKTVGVLPHGIMNRKYYTQEGFVLRGIFENRGGCVSDYYKTFNDWLSNEGRAVMHIVMPDGQRFVTDTFDVHYQRGRIVSALSDVMIVLEAGNESGSLDMGRKAFLQGRLVVVPNWDLIRPLYTGSSEPRSRGLTQLEREGCAIAFPPRDSARIVKFRHVPQAFLEFAMDKLHS